MDGITANNHYQINWQQWLLICDFGAIIVKNKETPALNAHENMWISVNCKYVTYMDAPPPGNNGKWRLVRSLQLSPKEIMKPFPKQHEQQYSLFEDLVWIKSSLHLLVLQNHLTTARRCLSLSLFPTLHGKSYVWRPGISSLPTSATPVGIVEGKHDHLSTPATTRNSILSCPDALQSHCGLPYAHRQVLKETWPGELLKTMVFCYKSLAFSNSSLFWVSACQKPNLPRLVPVGMSPTKLLGDSTLAL